MRNFINFISRSGGTIQTAARLITHLSIPQICVTGTVGVVLFNGHHLQVGRRGRPSRQLYKKRNVWVAATIRHTTVAAGGSGAKRAQKVVI
jgi:hypothetical protein